MTAIIHLGHPGFLQKMLIYCISKNIEKPLFLVDVTFASSETKNFLNNWNDCNSDFGRLITFTDTCFWVDMSLESLEKKIICFFDEKLKSQGVDLSDADQIFSAYDSLSAFGVYCCAKNKKFGILSFDGIPFDVAHETFHYTPSQVQYGPEAESYISLLKKYRVLSVYCPMVEKIICIGKHPSDDRCEDFDYAGVIDAMDDAEYRKISGLFHCNFERESFDYVVPLRSYSSVKYSGVAFSEKQSMPQKLLTVYRRLLDHIIGPNETVLLKAHPNFGIPNDVLKTIPRALYLPGYYPSEFVDRDLKDVRCICIGGSTASMLRKGYIVLPESFFSVGNVINSFMVALRIMAEIGAYPLKLIDSRLENYRPLIDLKLKKESSDLDSLIVDARRIPLDAICDMLKKGLADVFFIFNPPEHMQGCVTYHITELSTGDYREEYIGALSDSYIEIFDNAKSDCTFPEMLEIPMIRCGTCLRVKMEDGVGISDAGYTDVPLVQLDLGRAYRDGTYVQQDPLKASDFMFSAYCGGISWAGTELFDVLLKIGTPESLNGAVAIATESAESGNGGMQLRLARLYASGRGVPYDLNLAAKWMRMAAVHGPEWSKNELFDILWKINTPESLKEMISVAAEFADKGDGGAMGRMGRAYRDGKGVSRDLVKAAEWMRKAKDRNVPWAEWELVGILWRIATVEALEEIRGIIDAEIVKKK